MFAQLIFSRALTTPPGFRAQHLKAAVEAGKHAFVEITIAVDAPGVRSATGTATSGFPAT